MLYVPNGGGDFTLSGSFGTARPVAAGFGTALVAANLNTATDAYSATYAQIGGALVSDSYGMYINVNNYFAGAAFRQLALRFAVDYAGGTNFSTGQIIIDGLVGSQAITYGLGGLWYYFPIYIPAGATVGVTARGSTTTAPLPSINIRYATHVSNPSALKRGYFTETLGLTLGTGTVTGTSVTPGTTAEGAWTLIGTTTNRMWWWQIACQHSDTTMTALNYHVDLGVGTSTTVVDPIIRDQLIQTTGTEQFMTFGSPIGAEKVVPAGSNIYARVQNSGANENAGSFQIVAYGCGG
jgi:hypothetical protein